MSLFTQQKHQKTESQHISLSSLKCQEKTWEISESESQQVNSNTHKFSHPNLADNDEAELKALFFKERQENERFEMNSSYPSFKRREAVKWIVKVNAHFGFSNLTSILAINYFDRFLRFCCESEIKKLPWFIQRVAVSCVSLAAKVEEIYVPLLVDLQVEEAEFIFEAKTIQKMELMILSTLQWKMNPITPFSFFNHFMTKLGLETYLHWDFLMQCEVLLLSIVSDSRIINYLPSVLATATMLHIINQIELQDPIKYRNQLLSALQIKMESVNECYELILEISKKACFDDGENVGDKYKKRKLKENLSSPSCVIDGCFSSESSNDSWIYDSPSYSSSYSSASVCSSPKHVFKKGRGPE